MDDITRIGLYLDYIEDRGECGTTHATKFVYPVRNLLARQQRRIETLEKKLDLTLDTISRILKIGAGG